VKSSVIHQPTGGSTVLPTTTPYIGSNRLGLVVAVGARLQILPAKHLALLERKTEGDCLLAITSREIEETLYCMRLESGEPFGWRIMGEGMEAQLNAERREIIALLAEEPLAPREIASALKKNPNTSVNSKYVGSGRSRRTHRTVVHLVPFVHGVTLFASSPARIAILARNNRPLRH
jgi:hypothetical protein